MTASDHDIDRGPRGAGPIERQKSASRSRASRIRGESSHIQSTSDRRGLVHVATRDAQGQLWYFQQSETEERYMAYGFGNVGAGAPTVVLDADGVPTLLTVGPQGEILANTTDPVRKNWSGWRTLAQSSVTHIAAIMLPLGTLVLAARRPDGDLVAASQSVAGGRLGEWETLARGVQGPPAIRQIGQGLIILAPGPQGKLIEVQLLYGNGRFSPPQTIDGPAIRGNIATALLPSQRLVVATCDPKGAVFLRHFLNGKWSRARVVGGKTGLSGPRLVAVGLDTALISARDANGRVWMTNTSMRWINTNTQSDQPIDPVLYADGRVEFLSPSILVQRWLIAGVAVTIDAVEPPELFEGDDFEIYYTLTNATSEIAAGDISALPGPRWVTTHAEKLHPMQHVGPKPIPLGPWQTAHGVFKRNKRTNLTAGPWVFRVDYVNFITHATTIKVPWLAGAERELRLGGELEAAASDTLTVDVQSYRDRFWTDDPPDVGGAVACVQQTVDFNAPVWSYNFQNFARRIQAIREPTSISEVQTAVTDAVRRGQRIRVLADQPSHSSNSIICTEGIVISTKFLKGADSLDGTFETDLSAATPVIEDYEGQKTVRVGPGMRLHDLNKWLDGQGFSLGYAVPGFRMPTVAGAVATGTHGSSVQWSVVVSSRVRWLLVVEPDCTIREFTEGNTPEDKWKALRASLGYLGVVVQLRLSIEPAFNLRVKVRWTSAKDLVTTGPYELLRGSDFGEMMWFPQEGSDEGPVMVLYGTKSTDPLTQPLPENRLLRPGSPAEEAFSNFAIDQMENTVCDGRSLCFWEELRVHMMQYVYPAFTETNTEFGLIKLIDDIPIEWYFVTNFFLSLASVYGIVWPFIPILWLVALFIPVQSPEIVTKSYLAMSSDLAPIRPYQRDWEIFIPLRKAPAALQAAKAYFQANKVCLPLVGVFLRFAPAQEDTLIAHTTAFGDLRSGEPGMFFEMPAFLPKQLTCSAQRNYEKVYSDLAEVLVRDYGGRAHWGKNRASLFQLERRISTYGENLQRFRAVVQQTDPKGTFANQFGIDMGLRWPKAPLVPPDTEIKGCVPG